VPVVYAIFVLDLKWVKWEQREAEQPQPQPDVKVRVTAV
jgi:hypothetical protein